MTTLHRAASVLAFGALVAALGCEDDPVPPPCAPVELRVAHPWTLTAGREAHEWASLHRALRDDDAVRPGSTRAWADAQLAGEHGRCLETRYVVGRVLFEHPFTIEDGLGRGLEGGTPFQRVGGTPNVQAAAQACGNCHRDGQVAGSGRLVDAAFLEGDGARPESAERRVPPGIFGAGAVAALAAEMSADLQALRDALGRGREVALVTHGVSFGTLRRASDGGYDHAEVHGVSDDLIVRPFGWKGRFATLHAVVEAELERQLGIQANTRVVRGDAAGGGAARDPDRDGVEDELSDESLDALVAFLAAGAIPLDRPPEMVPPLDPSAEGLFPPLTPIYVDEWLEGRARFDALGCADCHRPTLRLRRPVFEEAAVRVDLAREAETPRLVPGDDGDHPVPLYSDLRRHDLGDANASGREVDGVGAREWLTRPLWGLAAREGYMHDGLATTLDEAIARHGGEAAASAEAFAALDFEARGPLRVFLLSLRPRPTPRVP